MTTKQEVTVRHDDEMDTDEIERSVAAGVRAIRASEARNKELEKLIAEAQLAVNLAEQREKKITADLDEERRLRVLDAEATKSEMTTLRLERDQAIAERAQYESFFRSLQAQCNEFVEPAVPVLRTGKRNGSRGRAGEAGTAAIKGL